MEVQMEVSFWTSIWKNLFFFARIIYSTHTIAFQIKLWNYSEIHLHEICNISRGVLFTCYFYCLWFFFFHMRIYRLELTIYFIFLSQAKYTTSCPKSLSYSYTISSCQPTCRSLSEPDVTCNIKFVPVDGCTCVNGTYMDESGKCVPANECPCYYKGSPIPFGEVVHENGRVW